MSKTSENGKSNTASLVIRIAVYGLVAVGAVFVWVEVGIRGRRDATLKAWQDELSKRGSDEAGQDRELLKSELAKFIVGDPDVGKPTKSNRPDYGAQTKTTYTWPGLLGNYQVDVHFGLAEDPTVELVEVPDEGE